MTEWLWIGVIWLVASLVVGMFVGRFIRAGSGR